MATTLPTLALQHDSTSYHVEPLRITAELASVISLTRLSDVALDGILAHALLEWLLGDDYYTLPDPKHYPLFVRLPLALQGPEAERIAALPSGVWLDIERDLRDHWWWYACSASQGEILARGTDYWNKRFEFDPAISDHLGFAGKNHTVVTEKGRYKNAHQAYSVLAVNALSWSVCGDGEEILRLLSRVGELAHKRVYGNGRVKRWRVEAMNEDESLWSADGHLMRPVPSLILAEMAPTLPIAAPLALAWQAFRAPQWAVYNQTLCATWS